jgi:DNA repair exonuclease SbcCD ATPase subunit
VNFSLRRISVANFRGVRGSVVLDFSATPSGLYFVRGENKDDGRLGSNGAGKALWDELELDTPAGLRRWGDLREGDQVFGIDGKPTTIVGHFPQGVKRLYRIRFDDGTSTVCSGDHLWMVYGGSVLGKATKDKKFVWSTEELLHRGVTQRGVCKWRVPRYSAVEYDGGAVSLPIDPYLLGYWSGNGSRKGNTTITVNGLDGDIVDRLLSTDAKRNVVRELECVLAESPDMSFHDLAAECNARGLKTYRGKEWDYRNIWSYLRSKRRNQIGVANVCANTVHVGRGDAFSVSVSGLSRSLKNIGLHGLGSHERYIPEMYRFGSVAFRLELVKGLMDSDGYVSKRGTTSFCSTSRRLIAGFVDVVRSLGGKVSPIKSKIGKYRILDGTIRECKEAYSVGFSLSEIPFFCKRKAGRCKPDIEPRYLDRWISSIDYVGEDLCSCITVSAKDGLFLANDFIVTHNSSLFTESIIWALTGCVSRSRRPGSDVENRNASGETRVDLEFALDAAVHSLSRTRNPNGLFLDGARVEQRDVDALLPLTDAALRKSVLIDQFGEMFLSLRPEAKSQIFTETLNLDKWLRAADAANERALTADRELQANYRKQEGVRRALAEAKDQFEAARRGEVEFEAELKAKMAEARKRERTLQEDADAKRDALDAARRKFSEADAAGGVRRLNDARAVVTRGRRDAEVVAASLARADAVLAALRKRMAAYDGDVRVCPECGQRVGESHVRDRRRALAEEVKAAEAACREASENVAAAADQSAAVDKTVAALEASAAVALEMQAENAVAAERSMAADREVRRTAAELAELKGRVNPFTKQCDALEVRVKELRSELKDLKAEESDLADRQEVAKFWSRGFKEIRLEQVDAALLELEMATNRHAEALGLEDWRIAFATERETHKGTVSHGFTVSLYPPGESEPVSWETYSGGESQRWQLAATFGLAEVLLARAGVSTDFEVLDEPTSHLSPEGIDDLLSCLYDRAREQNRRILLIDHNSLDRGAFDGVICVTKDKERGTYISDAGGVLAVNKPKRERVVL